MIEEDNVQNAVKVGDQWSENYEPSVSPPSTSRSIAAAAFQSPMDLLSTETLGFVVSYCDFQSALQFTRATSQSIRQDLYHGDHYFVWEEIFHRHHFSLPIIVLQHQKEDSTHHSSLTCTTITNRSVTATKVKVNYLLEIQKRRRLARNLLVPRRPRNGIIPPRSYCFNLPNRCFSFVPITPNGIFAEWDDPPPVDFGCDSFILTSTACGGEMVSLDPFHGTLSVYESCLDNGVASDEGMMEQAMLEAANLIDRKRENPSVLDDDDGDDEDWPEEHIAGAVFDQSVYRNHNMTSQYKKPPFQVLFRLDEDIDLEACFPSDAHDHQRQYPPPEIEVGYHGIDTKCILERGTSKVVGSMIAVGRMFTKETQINLQRDEQVCTELMCWTRHSANPEVANGNPRNHLYEGRKLCRFPWLFRSIDLCSIHNRVFVSFDNANGPLAKMFGTNQSVSLSASTVVAYQMVDHPPTSTTQKRQVRNLSSSTDTKFQQPEFLIHAKGEISALVVDPSGDTLVMGTTNGNCEMWRIEVDSNGTTSGTRTAIVNINSSIARAFPDTCGKNEVPYANSAHFGLENSARMQRKLLSMLNRPTISSFHHPAHCPLSACGFVTLQRSSSDGNSLLLWRRIDDDDTGSVTDEYRIVSMINLPLSGTTRAPRVFFDGRRILVLGQDHIGLIILVYSVLSSNEDIHLFKDATNEETSGGVYNLTTPSRTQFSNRIRHAALGGLEYYDSIHLTCNDRFIVVNTKTGNLLSGSASPYKEGLLVIDLED